MLFAKWSASGTPREEITSKTTRCFPGTLSNHSSCGWRAGWKGVAAACALVGRAPNAKAAATALIPDINDRRAHILFVISLLCTARILIDAGGGRRFALESGLFVTSDTGHAPW